MIKITCRHNRGRLKSAKETKVEKNENLDFYRHIFNSIFLLTRHSSVSKSYPETESLESTSKCRGRKSFHTWYYIVFCATICVRFSSKSKTTFFFQNRFWNRKHVSISSTKEKSVLLGVVKNYLCNVSRKFLI